MKHKIVTFKHTCEHIKQYSDFGHIKQNSTSIYKIKMWLKFHFSWSVDIN